MRTLTATWVTVKEEWQEVWQLTEFRRRCILGLCLVVAILSSFPRFFQHIEKRNGTFLHDVVLNWLPAVNVSLAIFITIWSITLFSVFRAAQHPYMFLTYVWAYMLLSLMRVTTITLIPLDPPAHLVALVDPISNFFYGEKFVTKDLFFSGHTSAMFLLYLTLPGKKDKILALIATVIVGFLVLVQHCHYTIDVLGAIVFASLAYWITVKFIVKK